MSDNGRSDDGTGCLIFVVLIFIASYLGHIALSLEQIAVKLK